jgi:hypothetical protein
MQSSFSLSDCSKLKSVGKQLKAFPLSTKKQLKVNWIRPPLLAMHPRLGRKEKKSI